mmetsp:Transcript_32028/g.76402  ORF Transcript_32028/g.76402 Transcript_32028/m.76402 type:complete len:217 (+) Transcript_32028:1215-1865(+)
MMMMVLHNAMVVDIPQAQVAVVVKLFERDNARIDPARISAIHLCARRIVKEWVRLWDLLDLHVHRRFRGPMMSTPARVGVIDVPLVMPGSLVDENLQSVLAFADPLAHAPERLCAMGILEPMDVPVLVYAPAWAGLSIYLDLPSGCTAIDPASMVFSAVTNNTKSIRVQNPQEGVVLLLREGELATSDGPVPLSGGTQVLCEAMHIDEVRIRLLFI